MKDEPDEVLSPEQESRLRAALASARVTHPTPDDVAARLDATLADLVAERDESLDPAAGPVPARPRAGSRGRSGRWLLLAGAASVAAVAAFSIPALKPHADDLTTTDGSSAGSEAKSEPGVPPTPQSGSDDLAGGAARSPGPVPLERGSFRSDVRALLDEDKAHVLTPVPDSTRPEAGAAEQPCAAGTPPPGVTEQRQVLLDGEPALLEVFRVRRGTRLIRAVSCDGIETLASTRIPAR